MSIITRTSAAVEPQDWQQLLAGAFRQADELLEYLEIPRDALPVSQSAHQQFPTLVPRPFAELMEKGNLNDPLLRQVLPLDVEMENTPGYVTDPLAEKHSNIQQGIIHKYHGRVLLLAASGCAVNCRYCFRRHFPYDDNRISRQQWQETLQYVAEDPSIEEVILSGGDPLMLKDQHLAYLCQAIEAIPHVTRLRIHSRLPVVIPQRITDALCSLLQHSRLHTSLVLHCNHANELTETHHAQLQKLRLSGVTLLNQAVLLKGINNSLSVLSDLHKQLFEFGVLPYYLHLLDPVAGAAHFDLHKQEALQLHQQMLETMPGYLVPRLVREEGGMKNKTPIIETTSQAEK